MAFRGVAAGAEQSSLKLTYVFDKLWRTKIKYDKLNKWYRTALFCDGFFHPPTGPADIY